MMTVLSSGAQAALTSFSVGPAFGPNRVNNVRQSVRLDQHYVTLQNAKTCTLSPILQLLATLPRAISAC